MAQVSTDFNIDTSVRDADGERSHPMNKFECYDNVDQIPRVFLQHTSCVCSDDSNSQHEIANATFVDDDGMDYSPSTKSVVPNALVAQVSYDNGDEYTNWILDSGSTYHMNGFANEFLT
jgi:hypothetical protein